MADFPTNPALNQVVTIGQTSYVCKRVIPAVWQLVSGSATPTATSIAYYVQATAPDPAPIGSLWWDSSADVLYANCPGVGWLDISSATGGVNVFVNSLMSGI